MSWALIIFIALHDSIREMVAVIQKLQEEVTRAREEAERLKTAKAEGVDEGDVEEDDDEEINGDEEDGDGENNDVQEDGDQDNEENGEELIVYVRRYTSLYVRRHTSLYA